MYSDYYVCFCNDDDHWWSKFLHDSIKHCYVIKPDNGRWLRHERVKEGYHIYTGELFSINGIIVVKYRAKPCKRGLFMLNTCVGHVKQILGINAWWILTPYQLYRYLEKRNEKSKSTKANG